MPDTRPIRVLALQPELRWLQSMPDMHLIRQTIEKALVKEPADLVVLPEVFNGVPADYNPDAGPQARQFLSTLAKACKIAVVGGSIDYQHNLGNRRNTCFLFDSSGNEVGSYHKRLLFAHERESHQKGDGPGIFELAGIRIGVLICGDLWEPNYVRELIDRIDLLCVPAKTTVPSDSHTEYARRLWWNLALTRAMENALPIVVSDWPESRHEATRLIDGTKVHHVHYTSGGASITNPGKRPHFDDIQINLPRGKPGNLSATINLEEITKFRNYRRSVGLLPEIN
ncbi:MAG: carbon-nitrogen hydrolase family protein [Planctomycetota bacterium]|nr:MAG: carbon-nitrogen hydrolase family protein [Planctomycetota bacterium]